MKRRRPEGEEFASGVPASPLSKAEVRQVISQEVRSAVEQTDKMMKSLMERVQEIDSEARYDARIQKLQAHVKKVKRRGDAVFVFIRKHGSLETLQNQRSLDSLQTLTGPEMTALSSANGECSGDSTSTSAVMDCEGVAGRKPKEGFWQTLRAKKQIVDLTDEAEVSRQNGKRHADSPLPAQTPVQKEEDTEAPPLASEQSKAPSTVAEENKKTAAEAAQALLQSKLPPFPDTPFPHQLPLEAATKNLPQKPVVKVARIENPQAIALLWNVEEEDPHAPNMDCYYIYVTQELNDGTFSKWKTMGVVKAMPLPMACRVSGRSGAKMLHFVIIGKDVYGRYGPYSDVQTVLASKT